MKSMNCCCRIVELPREHVGRFVQRVRCWFPWRPCQRSAVPPVPVPLGGGEPRGFVPVHGRSAPGQVRLFTRLPRGALRSLRLRFLWRRPPGAVPGLPLRPARQRQRRVRRNHRPVQLQAGHHRKGLHLLRSTTRHQSFRMQM